MNKTELIDFISAGADIPKSSAERVLISMMFHVIKAVSADEIVQIGGLGSFNQITRSARMGRNPANGLKVQLSATQSISFRASARFKRQINHL